jgi:hypothetical protein
MKEKLRTWRRGIKMKRKRWKVEITEILRKRDYEVARRGGKTG